MFLKILGKKISIQHFKNRSGSDEAMGRCDTKHNRIYICSDMPKESQEEVLLHEVIHFICDHVAMKLSERDITTLSSLLYVVLKENKGVL